MIVDYNFGLLEFSGGAEDKRVLFEARNAKDELLVRQQLWLKRDLMYDEEYLRYDTMCQASHYNHLKILQMNQMIIEHATAE